MDPKSKRKTTRSRLWPGISATIELFDFASFDSNRLVRLSGRVVDIGSRGMFMKTDESVPLPARARISINFNIQQSFEPDMTALGEVIRRGPGGIGLRFTSIDLLKLQKCIIARINGQGAEQNGAFHRLGPVRMEKPDDNVYRLQDHKHRFEGRNRKKD